MNNVSSDRILPDEAEVERRVARIYGLVESGEMELVGMGGGGAVQLAPPAAEWPARFEDVRARLAAALGDAAVRIDHVGSTSVPGIAAKPIIDVQLSVRDLSDEASYVPQIEALGWPLRTRELSREHMYFRDPVGVPRRVQIHVCQAGSQWERDHLLFRDYLRAHPERARGYEAVKQAAKERYGHDRVIYTEAKGPFIEETLALAEEWAREADWRP